MSLVGSTYFGFAQNTVYYFQNTVLNSVFDKCNKDDTKVIAKLLAQN